MNSLCIVMYSLYLVSKFQIVYIVLLSIHSFSREWWKMLQFLEMFSLTVNEYFQKSVKRRREDLVFPIPRALFRRASPRGSTSSASAAPLMAGFRGRLGHQRAEPSALVGIAREYLPGNTVNFLRVYGQSICIYV